MPPVIRLCTPLSSDETNKLAATTEVNSANSNHQGNKKRKHVRLFPRVSQLLLYIVISVLLWGVSRDCGVDLWCGRAVLVNSCASRLADRWGQWESMTPPFPTPDPCCPTSFLFLPDLEPGPELPGRGCSPCATQVSGLAPLARPHPRPALLLRL